MRKFQIIRQRVVTQRTTFEIEIGDDEVPVEIGNNVDPASLDWITVNSSDLSTDVVPIRTETQDIVSQPDE